MSEQISQLPPEESIESQDLLETDEKQKNKQDDVKKAAAKLIERYYFQIKNGCGSTSCDNPHCASGRNIGNLSSDEAACRALQLFSQQAKLCVTESTPCQQTMPEMSTPCQETMPEVGKMPVNDTDMDSADISSSSVKPVDKPTSVQEFEQILSECESSNDLNNFIILLKNVFSNENILKQSFLRDPDGINAVDGVANDASKKEESYKGKCDLDKDIDCQEELSEDKEMTDVEKSQDEKKKEPIKVLDLDSIKSLYNLIFSLPESTSFHSVLMDAKRQLLKDSLGIQLCITPQKWMNDDSIVNIFIIVLENPDILSPEYNEVLGDMCWCVSQISVEQQATLVKYFSKWPKEKITQLVQGLHQLITIKILNTNFTKDYMINDEFTIIAVTMTMKVIFYASIMAGTLDRPLLLDTPPEDYSEAIANQDHFTGANKESYHRPPNWDPLAKFIGIHHLDVRESLVELSEFYDDFLSDQLELDRDFAFFKAVTTEKFSFLNYPFILTPATKSMGLYYDNRIRMYSERRLSFYQSIMHGHPSNPYLNLHIRRDHIIEDALIELELVAMESAIDFKKQLVVEFENEQGIDEGGVSKEFFQLIIEQIFNPDYGMFVLNSESDVFWFNSTSFENDAQFTLIGIIVGLAIYNNIILDLHFPPVIYKKLCGKPGTFHDLQEWNKTLYNSLKSLLEYEDNDIEDVFMQSFRINYEDIFGNILHHDLMPQANNIMVNQSNKKEFVNLYADFLLNKSVSRQFFAMKRGFLMVTDDSPLFQLFRPEELENLICGSKNYDFVELKRSTEYDGGYTDKSTIINWFWEIVNEMSADNQKQLLQFTTGSARVPVGGLSRLKLTIARHGPDTERLPTAHTCFNVLLLPEYSSKEKLKERLLKAITYAQGFGML